MSKRTPAVAYYRMSTDKQEASIPEQKEWAGKATRKEHVDIVREFEDPGITGSEIDQRPDFMALLAYCEQRFDQDDPVGAIVCWDGDRFSRANSIRTAAVISRLMDAGVTKMLTPEGWIDWTNAMDRVLYNLRQDLSREAYSMSISKNVTRAKLARTLEGYWAGGPPPYGYVAQELPGRPEGVKTWPKKLALGDPEKVEAVRWIFRTYADTEVSLADIARELNKRGLEPPEDVRHAKADRDARASGEAPPPPKQWTRYTVRNIIQNRRYTGDSVWNEEHEGKYHRVRGRSVEAADAVGRDSQRRRRGLKNLQPEPNVAEDLIVRTDAHPALTDRETFARANEKLRASFRKRTTPLPARGPWSLSGLLFCGDCHSVMWGSTITRRQGEKVYVYRRYQCGRNRHHGVGAGGCRRNAVDPAVVMDEVVKLIQQEVGDPRRVEKLRKELAHLGQLRREDLATARKQLQERSAVLEKQLDQGNENLALLPAHRLPGVLAKLDQWEKEKEQLERELANLRLADEPGADLGDRLDTALAQLGRLGEIVKEAEPAEVRAMLAGIVKKVTLHFRHLTKEPKPGGKRTELESLEVELTEDFCNLLHGEPGTCDTSHTTGSAHPPIVLTLRGRVERRSA